MNAEARWIRTLLHCSVPVVPERGNHPVLTDRETVPESAGKVIDLLIRRGYLFGPADLHLHTTASDGSLSPREVVRLAKEAGLSTIAITDHDSTAGLSEALEAGREMGIEVIPGIELSTLDETRGVHLLGYFIDPAHPVLRKILRELVEARYRRARLITEKLIEQRINISWPRVRELAGSRVVGRSHIARALQEQGYIREKREAFTPEYLGRGGKAYVDRYRLTLPEAIGLIRQAGGFSVLAHPGYLRDGAILGEEDIARYVELGVAGIEAYYSRHTLERIKWYRDLAKRHHLLITGGSDFHDPDDHLLGSVFMPGEAVEELKEAKRRMDSRRSD